MLLIGVPGTGKSLVARAIAATWRLPLLRLDMARILGSLVGQSETQTQQALRLAEAMAPAVLHVDEIEKALAGAGAGHLDSGVTSRVVGQLLTWLQERGLGPDGAPAPVFVAATANRVEALPPELFRPGRFDQVFFLDLPEAAERAAVLKIHLAKRRQRLPADAQRAGFQAGSTQANGASAPRRCAGRRESPLPLTRPESRNQSWEGLLVLCALPRSVTSCRASAGSAGCLLDGNASLNRRVAPTLEDPVGRCLELRIGQL